jgi:hypothetical protein
VHVMTQVMGLDEQQKQATHMLLPSSFPFLLFFLSIVFSMMDVKLLTPPHFTIVMIDFREVVGISLRYKCISLSSVWLLV